MTAPSLGPHTARGATIYGADGRPVADCWTPKRKPAEREANARLLAAAWSLCEAAVSAIALLDCLPVDVAVSLPHLERCGEVRAELAAAVARAGQGEAAA